MADCLDRTDRQGITRDEFFSLHNKSKGLIDSSSLCISTVSDTTVLSEKCQDSLRNQNDLSVTNMIVGTDLKKSDDIEITSGFVVLNNDYSKKVSHKSRLSISEQLRGEDLNKNAVPHDITVVPVLSTAKSDSCTPLKLCSNSSRTCTGKEDENLFSNITRKIKVKSDSNVVQFDQSKPTAMPLSNQDSECCEEQNSICDNDERVNISQDVVEYLETETVPIQNNSVSESYEVISNTSPISAPEDNENSNSNDFKSSSCDTSVEKEIAESSPFSSCNETLQNLKSCKQRMEELSETCSNKFKELIGSENADMLLNSEYTRNMESDYILSEAKSEIIDIKPDIHEMTVYEEVIESDMVNECNTNDEVPSEISMDVEVNEFKNKMFCQNRMERVQPKLKESSKTDKTLLLDLKNETIVKKKSTEYTDKGTFNHRKHTKEHKSMKHFSKNNLIKNDLIINRSQEGIPSHLKSSRCTIQLVSKSEGKSIVDKRANVVSCSDNRKAESENGIAECLESLTGTVKIGCLSVTPLHPHHRKEVKEELKKESNSSLKVINEKINVAEDSNRSGCVDNKDSYSYGKNISVFLKNEKFLKNNVDITISPKCSDSGIDSVETLKVKIPQLIESFTGKVSREKTQLMKQEAEKNYIVNKNLKIIESFLMQKGFQKEANILKEKTEIIKPYLEDIALKMEKTINERSGAQIHPDIKETPTAEFTKFMYDYSRKSETSEHKKSVEKELAALTEKFLNSSAANQRQSARRYEDYMEQSQHLFHSGPPSSIDKVRLYDRYYGKPYYEGLDYLTSRDPGCYTGRAVDPYGSKVYRSSRYDMRENECNFIPPEMSMYDQFLPEFDNKMHPSTLLGTSLTFNNSDFSQFIDEYTAEKYNNFIHFMVPDNEALAFDALDYKKWRISDEYHVGNGQPMNCCLPMIPPMNQMYPLGPSQYPVMPQPPQMVPPVPSHSLHQQISPAMGRPLPMDSSKESCSQLTITPLDECGKPYGSVPPPSDPCPQGFCNDSFSCGQSLPPGMLPPLPPLVPADSLLQQLTITPLHQSSNSPYLHRTIDSASRRRGRPPMDPEYGAVGYRKDAYANVRFSRSDFMARVQSNVDSCYMDPRFLRMNKMLSDHGTTESQLMESLKHGLSSSTTAETKVLPPPLITPVTSAPKAQPTVVSTSIETPVSTPSVATKTRDPAVKPPTSVKAPLPTSSIPAPSLLSNGYKRLEQTSEKPVIKNIEAIPKQTKKPPSEPMVPTSNRTPFQVTSKQVKINPERFLPSSSVKISLVEKKAVAHDSSNKTPALSITKMSTEDQVSPELSGMLKKNIPGLQTVLKNTNITLKTVNVAPVKKDNVEVKNENISNESKNAEVLDDSQLIPKDKVVATEVKNSNKNCAPEVSTPMAEVKEVISEISSIVVYPQMGKTDSELGATKISPVKAKKRRRFPHFKKKKKRGKAKISTDVHKKVIRPRKVIEEKSISNTYEKSDTHNDSSNKANEKNSSVNISNNNNNNNNNNSFRRKEPECSESSDKFGDGIRRSGRKRKIIEGNPKFRDMERVDLKYFREERLKPASVKRKLDTKASSQEIIAKKRIQPDQKTSKSSNIIITINESQNAKSKNNAGISKENEAKTKEKLQQFLQINDIYLKPQTFV